MAMSAIKMSVATKKPQLTAYVEPEINEAIEQEARKERRSRSQMVALLIEEALAARGYQFTTEIGQSDVDERA